MAQCRFRGFRLNAEASNVTDKWGELPHRATKTLFFEDDNGKVWKTTDLAIRKGKRNKSLFQFSEAYRDLFKTKQVSILLVIIKENNYASTSSFLKDFKKKLTKKGMYILGYVWTRDIGDIKFEKHSHVIIALDRITGAEFRSLMGRRKDKKYNAELCNNLQGFKEYLRKKELYGAKGQRSYGASKLFRRPSVSKRIKLQ